VVSAAKPEYLRNSSEVNARSVLLRRLVVPVQRFSLDSLGSPREELPEEAAIGQHLHGERSDDGREGNGRPNQEIPSLHVSRICQLHENGPRSLLLYDSDMPMVLSVPDRVAERLRECAAQRGESVEDFAVTVLEGSPLLQATSLSTTLSDGLLESFLGCGASGDKRADDSRFA
jgi:hypothetical protein